MTLELSSLTMGVKKIKKHIDSLRALCHFKPKQIKAVLENSDKELVGCICECMYNVANGSFPVPPRTLTKLKRHKSKIRKAINKSTSFKKRKRILAQSGGFLPLLLAPIVSLVGGLVGEAIGSAMAKK